jgi:hypothetical protein
MELKKTITMNDLSFFDFFHGKEILLKFDENTKIENVRRKKNS